MKKSEFDDLVLSVNNDSNEEPVFDENGGYSDDEIHHAVRRFFKNVDTPDPLLLYVSADRLFREMRCVADGIPAFAATDNTKLERWAALIQPSFRFRLQQS